MIRYHAAWVVPVAAAPLRHGWVDVRDGRIAAVGAGNSATPREDRDLGDVAILPGLVNAHTHLELSHLRGRIPPARDFVTWIRQVVATRRTEPDPRAPHVLAGIDAGIAEALACGTALVGDISNTLATFGPLAASPLAAVVFYELIRFHSPDPEAFVAQALTALDALPTSERVRSSLAAHAPYSVAPDLFPAIRRALNRDPLVPSSVHLAESAAETEFIATGSGPWRQFLEDVGAWNPAWTPPGVGPVAYLDSLRFLDDEALAVHGVQMTRDDLALLARRGTTLVTCPRSNVLTGAGTPPVADFYSSGVAVAVGTDSLASTPDLNVFAELAELRRLAPHVSASRLIESATRQGARALGFQNDYGTIEAGKRARLIAVSIPKSVSDVEEYLVNGVEPGQLRWLD